MFIMEWVLKYWSPRNPYWVLVCLYFFCVVVLLLPLQPQQLGFCWDHFLVFCKSLWFYSSWIEICRRLNILEFTNQERIEEVNNGIGFKSLVSTKAIRCFSLPLFLPSCCCFSDHNRLYRNYIQIRNEMHILKYFLSRKVWTLF